MNLSGFVMCVRRNSGKERLEDMPKKDLGGKNQVSKLRAKIVELALHEIKENTFVYTLPLLSKFKKYISDNNLEQPASTYMRSLSMCIDKYLTRHGFSTYCGVTKLGKLFYDNKVHSLRGIEHVYKVVVDKYKLEKEKEALQEQQPLFNIKEVQELTEDQCKKFPTTSKFDYCTLINSDKIILILNY